MSDRPQSLAFDRVADRYDETRGGVDRGRHLGHGLAAALADVGIPAGSPVLEIGVGTGVVADGLRVEGWDAVGVDLSLPMLRRARERLGPRVAQADVSRLPCADRSVPSVAAAWVLHLVQDVAGVLAEVARVLRPGGAFAVVLSRPDAPSSEVDVVLGALADRLFGGRPRQDDAGRVAELAAAAGLRPAGRRLVGAGRTAVSPAAVAQRIADRTYSWLWDVDDDTWVTTVTPALAELAALPDPQRPREGEHRYPLLVFTR